MLQIQQIPVNSNRSCQKFLNRAGVETDEKLRQDPVMVPWFDRAAVLKQSFIKGMDNLHATNTNLVQATTERNTCGLKMERTARDCRFALIRAIKRNEMPEFLPAFFEIPNGLSGSQARVSEDWYQISHWLIKGDEKAREAGYAINLFPSIEELVTCREAFAEKRVLADAAERAVKEARAEMSGLRERVHITARGLASNIRLVLYKEEDSSIRETLRGYGFSFRGNGGEEIPEDNTPDAPILDQPSPDPIALNPPLPDKPIAGEALSFNKDEPIHSALVLHEPQPPRTDASLHETSNTPVPERMLAQAPELAKGEAAGQPIMSQSANSHDTKSCITETGAEGPTAPWPGFPLR